jgi:methylated-DNA-protein-cysteine methyltransferase-like protein
MRRINFYEAVYQVVQAIPFGQVTTYGSIATWLGTPRAARAVGYALAADSCGDIPWHRVVNQQGQISVGGAPWRPDEQRRRLRAEKVKFSESSTLRLTDVSFRPDQKQLRKWMALGNEVRALRLAR